MRTFGLGLAVILAIGALSLAQPPVRTAVPPLNAVPVTAKHQQWEYKEIHSSVEYLNMAEFNEYGKDGWELCTSQQQRETSFYIFKRPKMAAPAESRTTIVPGQPSEGARALPKGIPNAIDSAK